MTRTTQRVGLNIWRLTSGTLVRRFASWDETFSARVTNTQPCPEARRVSHRTKSIVQSGTRATHAFSWSFALEIWEVSCSFFLLEKKKKENQEKEIQMGEAKRMLLGIVSAREKE